MIEIARMIQDRIDSQNKKTQIEALKMFNDCPSVVSFMDKEYIDKLEEIYQQN